MRRPLWPRARCCAREGRPARGWSVRRGADADADAGVGAFGARHLQRGRSRRAAFGVDKSGKPRGHVPIGAVHARKMAQDRRRLQCAAALFELDRERVKVAENRGIRLARLEFRESLFKIVEQPGRIGAERLRCTRIACARRGRAEARGDLGRNCAEQHGAADEQYPRDRTGPQGQVRCDYGGAGDGGDQCQLSHAINIIRT